MIDLDICNLAIDKVSGDRIAALDEDSPLGVFCKDNYPHKRAVLLGKYRWTFATKVRALTRVEIAEGETRIMGNKFQVPADLVGAIHAARDQANPQAATRTPYMLLEGGYFWADDAVVFVEYTAARAEADWPTWFRDLVVVAFAADLALHCQMRTLARDLETRAFGTPQENGEGGLYGQARNEDARMAPQRKLVAGVDAGALIEARYSSGTFAGRFGLH